MTLSSHLRIRHEHPDMPHQTRRDVAAGDGLAKERQSGHRAGGHPGAVAALEEHPRDFRHLVGPAGDEQRLGEEKRDESAVALHAECIELLPDLSQEGNRLFVTRRIVQCGTEAGAALDSIRGETQAVERFRGECVRAGRFVELPDSAAQRPRL